MAQSITVLYKYSGSLFYREVDAANVNTNCLPCGRVALINANHNYIAHVKQPNITVHTVMSNKILIMQKMVLFSVDINVTEKVHFLRPWQLIGIFEEICE